MGVSSAPPPPLLRGIYSWYFLLWRPVAFGEEERREGGVDLGVRARGKRVRKKGNRKENVYKKHPTIIDLASFPGLLLEGLGMRSTVKHTNM